MNGYIKYLVGILLACMMTVSPGCKKCISCRGRCFYCTNYRDTLCRSDYANSSIVDTLVNESIQQGYVCTPVSSATAIEACGSNSERSGVQNLLEPLGYECK